MTILPFGTGLCILHDSTLIIEETTSKTFCTVRFRLASLDVSHFWWPIFGWKTSTLFQNSKPRSYHEWLNCWKLFFCYIVDTGSEVLCFSFALHGSSFVPRSHLTFIYRSCKCFFKIPWTRAYDKCVHRVNCLAVNRASFFSILRMFSTLLLVVVIVAGWSVWAAFLSCFCPLLTLDTHRHFVLKDIWFTQ